MKMIYDEKFRDSRYADDNAALPGRMEAAMSGFSGNPGDILAPHPASEEQIMLAHDKTYIDTIAMNKALFSMASLAAGGAILAAEEAFGGNPSFACIRPPGHHASSGASWGHCFFNNIAIALLVLRDQKRIKSAFVIDIDAHTGDGTRNVLKGWKEAEIFNPFAESPGEYLAIVEQRLSEIKSADIIAVSAGFDSYIHDVGHKLETPDFEHIGSLLGKTAKRLCRGRRFAVLEGGYYLKDLGANIASFCRGFSA